MPELPDVETFRRFLNRTAIEQPIEKIGQADVTQAARHFLADH